MEPSWISAAIGQIVQSLALGEPYWPEIGLAIATVTCGLWLALRMGNRKQSGTKENSPE